MLPPAVPEPPPSEIVDIATSLDPTLVPLGFAPGQVGSTASNGQVIFCRGVGGSDDGSCVDLVIDVESSTGWRISDVRYWGFPSDRWHLPFDRDAALPEQLERLARTLPGLLGIEQPSDV